MLKVQSENLEYKQSFIFFIFLLTIENRGMNDILFNYFWLIAENRSMTELKPFLLLLKVLQNVNYLVTF